MPGKTSFVTHFLRFMPMRKNISFRFIFGAFFVFFLFRLLACFFFRNLSKCDNQRHSEFLATQQKNDEKGIGEGIKVFEKHFPIATFGQLEIPFTRHTKNTNATIFVCHILLLLMLTTEKCFERKFRTKRTGKCTAKDTLAMLS